MKVNVSEEPGGGSVDEQVVIGAGFCTIFWGDKRGVQSDPVFGIECEYPLLGTTTGHGVLSTGTPTSKRRLGYERAPLHPACKYPAQTRTQSQRLKHRMAPASSRICAEDTASWPPREGGNR